MTDGVTLIAELSIRQEILPLRMICGCLLHTSDPFVTDSEGFIVCPTHNERRYGWRSVPYASYAPVRGMGAWTSLEYEAYVLFGKKPIVTEWDEDYVATVEDRRDNRDPEEVLRSSATGTRKTGVKNAAY